MKQLLLQSDVLLLEETWLFTNEFHVISKYFNSYESISISTLKQYNIMMKMENNQYYDILLLDVTKPFDSVCYSELFIYIFRQNVCSRIVQLLCYMYFHQACCVK